MIFRTNTFGGRGFTLVEVLFGVLVLSLGAIALCAISSHSMQRQREGMAYEQAWRLMDATLDRISSEGPPPLSGQTSMTGEFAAPYTAYRYEVTFQPQGNSDLARVTARVYWSLQEKERMIEAETVLYVEPS